MQKIEKQSESENKIRIVVDEHYAVKLLAYQYEMDARMDALTEAQDHE